MFASTRSVSRRHAGVHLCLEWRISQARGPLVEVCEKVGVIGVDDQETHALLHHRSATFPHRVMHRMAQAP